MNMEISVREKCSATWSSSRLSISLPISHKKCLLVSCNSELKVLSVSLLERCLKVSKLLLDLRLFVMKLLYGVVYLLCIDHCYIN